MKIPCIDTAADCAPFSILCGINAQNLSTDTAADFLETFKHLKNNVSTKMQQIYYKPWIQRDDAGQGFVYLIIAEGFHGWIPGCFIKRVKIGLSRNPQKRLAEFHSNQPPCNMRILKTIYVHNMAETEAELHKIFKDSRVTNLHSSKEFFDLNLFQLVQVKYAFDKRAVQQDNKLTALGLILVALLGVVSIGGGLLSQSPNFQKVQTQSLKH